MKNSPALKKAALAALALMVVAGVAYVLTQAGPLAPVKVTVTQAQQTQFAPALFGIGVVEARRSYALGPTMAARIKTVSVDVGDTVKAGQVLAEMDPVDLDERTRALDASAARAESVIAQADAQQADALARRKIASSNAQRYRDLAQQNFISSSALEARLQEQASADAQSAAATAAASAARQDLKRLRSERAALQQQRQNLKLLAPVDGVVTGRDGEQGATMLAGQAVVRMVEPTSLWIKTRFDQARSAGLAVGLRADVQLRSSPGEVWQGKVARVEAISDNITEERLAHITLDALPTGLSIGEAAEVTLQLPSTPPSIVIPGAAIKVHEGRSGVWRMDGGNIRFVPVRKGASSPQGLVQILDGLNAGEAVVVYSQKELAPGTRIRVVDALVDSSAEAHP